MDFNKIYQNLISGNTKLALVGLGYVGMPIAVEFAKHVKVVGFDINKKKDDGRSHVGLSNIKKRLETMLDAYIETESVIGEGTTVTVKIPKKEN